MCIDQILNGVLGGEIKAQSKIDHSAYYKWPANSISAVELFARKFQRSIRIRLPEIHARAEPVEIVVAGFEGFCTGKQTLS
jgi:hypothetical protein